MLGKGRFPPCTATAEFGSECGLIHSPSLFDSRGARPPSCCSVLFCRPTTTVRLRLWPRTDLPELRSNLLDHQAGSRFARSALSHPHLPSRFMLGQNVQDDKLLGLTLAKVSLCPGVAVL